eukprot:11409977-Karenia_brevis.AAC.1
MSRALAAIALGIFGVQCVEFFDDFSQLEPQATASSAQESIEKMFDLLGWKISMKEEKRRAFAGSFVSLGALVGLPRLGTRKIIVDNKPGRIESILELIAEALNS